MPQDASPSVPTVEDARRITDNVEGWLQPQEGPLLFELARACRGRGAIVEIGSWKGKSTIWLALGARASGTATKVTAIDPHVGSEEHQKPGQQVWTFEEFTANIRKAGVEDRVLPVVKDSVSASKDFDGSVELLWIDGAHDYESVLADIQAWTPKLVDGGVVAFHDSRYPDTRRAIEERIYRGHTWTGIQRVEGITWARKVARATPAQRVQNLARMWARRLYDGAYHQRSRIPAPLKAVGKRVLQLVDRDATR